MSIYVCSDLHGQYELYKQMMAKIGKDDTLYLIGDVIDRGPGSLDILKDMMKRKNVVYLLGNHEHMMWSHETKDYAHDYWFNGNNGGRYTKSMILKQTPYMQKKIRDYIFNQTKLQVELEVNGKTFLLSHSFFMEDKGTIDTWQGLDYRTIERVVWYSPWRDYEHVSKNQYDDGRLHIIGHVPVQAARYTDYEVAKFFNKEDEVDQNYDRLEILRTGSIIDIDGGCSYLSMRSQPFNDCGLILLNLSKFGQEDDVEYLKLNASE